MIIILASKLGFILKAARSKSACTQSAQAPTSKPEIIKNRF
jgi:hypothetical protein